LRFVAIAIRSKRDLIAEFRPANFDSMEERARHMEAMGKAAGEAVPVSECAAEGFLFRLDML